MQVVQYVIYPEARQDTDMCACNLLAASTIKKTYVIVNEILMQSTCDIVKKLFKCSIVFKEVIYFSRFSELLLPYSKTVNGYMNMDLFKRLVVVSLKHSQKSDSVK